MKLHITATDVVLRITRRETEAWANRPGARWPCSTLAGRAVTASFDAYGLYDVSVEGRAEIDEHEFGAMISDMLRDSLPADHPAYFVTVGQYD